MSKLKNKIDEAFEQWEDASDSTMMLKLLAPLEKDHDIDFERSNQKGCDCSAIEVSGRYLCPYDDSDSGEAIVLLLSLLQELYLCVEVQFSAETRCTVICHKPDEVGPTAKRPTFASALLDVAIQTGAQRVRQVRDLPTQSDFDLFASTEEVKE